jgi:hypothetical protein
MSDLDSDDPPEARTRELVATVRDVIWRAPDTGFVVLALDAPAGSPGDVAAGDDPDGLASPGSACRFLGRWVTHRQHGRQFSFSGVIRHVPAEQAGVVRYIRDLCVGVGDTRARRLWAAYGPDAIRVLRTEPGAVVAAGHLPNDVAHEASDTLNRVMALEATRVDLWTLFDGRGFPRDVVEQCVQTWGVRAPAVVRHNAFALLGRRVRGASFARCDRLYLDLGGDPLALRRQLLCGWHAMRSDREGHTWFAARWVAARIQEGVGADATPEQALRLGVRGRLLAERRDAGGGWWLADAQAAAAEGLLARQAGWMLADGWARQAG